MNHKLVCSALALMVAFASCTNRQYARVQPAKTENFTAKKTAVATPDVFTIEPLNVAATYASTDESFSENSTAALPILEMPAASQTITVRTDVSRQKITSLVATPIAKYTSAYEKAAVNKDIKKKKKKKGLFGGNNTFIPGGLILLGIAILLALININGLALLFGAASILFLYLGIRKMMRKNRRRNIFNR